jgi:hypothetical protein
MWITKVTSVPEGIVRNDVIEGYKLQASPPPEYEVRRNKWFRPVDYSTESQRFVMIRKQII